MTGPDIFTFEAPARLTFGVGALARLPELVAGMGTRVLIVSDPGIVKAGILDRVASLLKDAGVTGDAFTQVEPNPSVETVHAAHDMFRRSRAAFGFPSVADRPAPDRTFRPISGRGHCPPPYKCAPTLAASVQDPIRGPSRLRLRSPIRR